MNDRRDRRDCRDTPTSCLASGPLDAYEEALVQFQSYVGDAVATIDRALAAQPDFVLGHVFRAGVLMTFGEQRFASDARRSVAAAEALAAPRQRSRACPDRARCAGSSMGTGTARAPRSTGCWSSTRATCSRSRPRTCSTSTAATRSTSATAIARVLPHWSPSVPGYSYVLGMHAFGLEECNQYDEAARRGEARARARATGCAGPSMPAPTCWRCSGQVDEGIAWLERAGRDWAPDNGFAFHNLVAPRAVPPRSRSDRGACSSSTIARSIRDPTSISRSCSSTRRALLWRLHLGGVDVGARMAQLADLWEAKLDGERGFYAFNDVHALFAFVATGREASIARVVAGMEAAIAGRAANAAMTREVGMPIARALRAFGAGRHREARRRARGGPRSRPPVRRQSRAARRPDADPDRGRDPRRPARGRAALPRRASGPAAGERARVAARGPDLTACAHACRTLAHAPRTPLFAANRLILLGRLAARSVL